MAGSESPGRVRTDGGSNEREKPSSLKGPSRLGGPNWLFRIDLASSVRTSYRDKVRCHSKHHLSEGNASRGERQGFSSGSWAALVRSTTIRANVWPPQQQNSADTAPGARSRSSSTSNMGRGARPRRPGLSASRGRARPNNLRHVQLLENHKRVELCGEQVRASGYRQQQHRQLQPYLTRHKRRRSGDSIRSGWRD